VLKLPGQRVVLLLRPVDGINTQPPKTIIVYYRASCSQCALSDLGWESVPVD
jgi:hypothetical protein